MSSELNQPDLRALVRAVNDAAKRVIAPWITLLVAMAYMFVATFAVTQEALLRNTPAKLPIFNVDLPLLVFFCVAPGLILILHFYCIVQFIGLVEKVESLESALKAAMPIKSDRQRFRAAIDLSFLTRVPSERYERWPGFIGWIYRTIFFVTMAVFPVSLLLIFQLKFLAFQDEFTTWLHRIMVIIDVGFCVWLWTFITISNHPRFSSRWTSLSLRCLRTASFVMLPFGVLIWSIGVASFPGEAVYENLTGTWLQTRLTQPLLESPIDYVSGGVARWFSNRLVLVDRSFVSIPPLSLRGRNLRKAVLDRSDLHGVDFTAADMWQASLRASNLESARFRCATPSQRISEWRFDDSKVDPLSDCAALRETNLSYANLSNTDFQDADLRGAQFVAALMNNTVFKGTTIMGGAFILAHGRAADFSYSQLQGSDFSQSQFRLGNFSGAGLQGARMAGAYFQGATFDDARLQGASLTNSRLQGASLKRAYLQNALLDWTAVQGATFAGSSLESASLRCLKHYRTDIANADLTNVRLEEPCKNESAWYTTAVGYYYSPASNFDMKGDSIPNENDAGSYDYSVPLDADDDLETPDKLDDAKFAPMMARLTSDLSDEYKARMGEALSVLRPSARTKA